NCSGSTGELVDRRACLLGDAAKPPVWPYAGSARCCYAGPCSPVPGSSQLCLDPGPPCHSGSRKCLLPHSPGAPPRQRRPTAAPPPRTGIRAAGSRPLTEFRRLHLILHEAVSPCARAVQQLGDPAGLLRATSPVLGSTSPRRPLHLGRSGRLGWSRLNLVPRR